MTGIIITDEERKRVAASRLRHKSQQRTKDGLVSGMTAVEIRDAEAQQCEALLQHAAKRLMDLRTPVQAMNFVAALACRMGGEIES